MERGGEKTVMTKGEGNRCIGEGGKRDLHEGGANEGKFGR